jgi:hypothetical protein
MKSKIYVVIIDVDECMGCARSALEATEYGVYNSCTDYITELNQRFSIDPKSVSMYSLTDFMDEYNNETLNVDGTFMGYVRITT